LRPELGRLLSAMGIRVREGYGMTETSPVISLNHFTPGLYAFGTVGLPLPGVEVHIDQPDEDGEGEILVRGPNVMMGYYRQPDATRQVIDEEGWFHTGDVGRFVRKRFLQITDRKKDIFKTSAGKYIAPLALENYFRESPFIEQIMIIGFQRPYLTALIKPNFEWLELWCRERHIHWTGPQYMVHNIKVKQKLSEEVDALNAELPNFQTIRKFHLVHQEWTVESGMLTYTLKLVRSRILELYAKEIEALYPR
ncbi:MAG: AMP-binding protein, partial [Saprospiraceae bacterium]|nr:AMP-binding protein [Saprospiraceae bacterium]